MTKKRRALIDGSTSRTLILLASLGSVTVCALTGTIGGDVYSAIVAAVIGGVVHASGTNQGSQATVDPPPG